MDLSKYNTPLARELALRMLESAGNYAAEYSGSKKEEIDNIANYIITYHLSSLEVLAEHFKCEPEDLTPEVLKTITQLPKLSKLSDTEKNWTKINTWENELIRVQEKISEVTKQIILSDGALRLEYEQTYRMLRRREREVKLEIMRRKINENSREKINE